MPLTLADLTARQREEIDIAFHEAGHAVAAVALGGVIRSAVVASSRVTGVQGLTTVVDMPTSREPEIAYGGPWAQARWRAGRRPSQRELFALLDKGGRCDRRVLTASGGTHTGHDVVPLLSRAWPGVIRVAQQLFINSEATHADICAALGITDGGGSGSSQIASLRSGLRAVPPIATRAA